jgi:hypothetical protein
MKTLVRNRDRLLFMRSEALRVARPSPEFFRYIRKHRLDIATVNAHAGFLNVALVKFWTGNDGDQMFSFDSEGEPSVVIEALLFDGQREPSTADLVAWPMGAPEAFCTAMGRDDGADVLGPVNMIQRGGMPLRVHQTPLAWLRSGCEGCCLLKPGARHWLERAGGPFIVEDVEHGRDLRDLLGGGGHRHRILVPIEARAA